MYVTPSQRKKTIIIAVAIAISIPIIVLGVFLVSNYVSNASAESSPRDVIISNLTSTSVTVNWVTDGKANATVNYSPNPTGGQVVASTGQTSSDSRGAEKRQTHYVEITGLEPETVYNFSIESNGTEYKNNDGTPFTFTTAPVEENAPVPNPVYGNVEGVNLDDALVYIVAKNGSDISFPLSAVVRSGGNWIIDLSALRNVSDFSAISVSSDTDIIILAQGGDNGNLAFDDTYGGIFDSSGRMKDTVALTLKEGVSIMSKIPQDAIIVETLAEAPVEEEPIEVEPIEEEPIEEEPVEEEPETGTTTIPIIEEDDSEIAMDVEWNAIVLGESTAATVSVPTGNSSIKITNITDTKFSVVWVSAQKEEGTVIFGVATSTGTTTLNMEARDIRDSAVSKGSYYTHQVDVTKLVPETRYAYEIHSGTTVLKDGVNPYYLETFPTLSSPPPYKAVGGTLDVYTTPGDTVVFATLIDKDSSGTATSSIAVSTIPSSNGSWVLSIGDARSLDGSEYFVSTSQDVLRAQVIAPVASDPVEQSVTGIEDVSIVVATKSATLSVTSSKVAPLSFYGVFATLNDLLGGTGGIGGSIPMGDSGIGGVGGTIPKTGLSPLQYIFIAVGIIGGSAVSFVVVKVVNKKDEKFKKMVDKFR